MFDEASNLLLKRQVRAAVELFDRAETLAYDRNECAAGRWQCWMLLGEFERAWQESDLIRKSAAHDPNRFWDGASWCNRKVMLRCLHGLGDTIQFIRYAPMLRQTCNRLTVQTHPQLVRLLAGVQGVDHVTSWGPGFPDDHSEWELQMEVTELPMAFRTTVLNIPSSFPYIHVPDETVTWASRWFGDRDGSLRVGVVWEAGDWDTARSIPLNIFSELFRASNCQFYSLQKTARASDLAAYPTLRNIEANSIDVLDTASLMTHLDLVITVDTMTAHLAGALNIPVWIILPNRADWRWMLQTNYSPWYRRARLFRRSTTDWLPLINELLSNLERKGAEVRLGALPFRSS